MKSTKPEQPPVAVKEKVWMVQAMTAQFEQLAPVQTLYGKVESSAMVFAAAPVTGVVEQVFVKEGVQVDAMAPLVNMSAADLAIPLQQAKADVADARAQMQLQSLANKANSKRLAHEQKVLQLKQDAVARTEQLMRKDLASQSTLDAAKEALVKQEYIVVGAQLAVEESQLRSSQNKARLQKALAGLQQAELNQQRGQLKAPYAARIASVDVSAGSRVNAGALMLSFYALDSLELRAKLPVSELAQVHQALDSDKQLTASYHYRGGEVKLPLTRLAGQATTSGVDAFFELPAALASVRPGDLMEVHLSGVAADNVLAVPYSAIYGNDRVYLIEAGRLQSKQVEMVGEVMRDGKLWALIRPDFAEGARISITHLPNAVTGLKVAEFKASEG